MALRALLIQRRLKCSDQWLVKHIGENLYLQYFIGIKECGPYPFGASTLMAFRNGSAKKTWRRFWRHPFPKRRQRKKMIWTTEAICPTAGRWFWTSPAALRTSAYPQDINLLNQAREKAEKGQSDWAIIIKQLGITEHQRSYITHSNSGEGLLFYASMTIPFTARFSRGEIYNLLTICPENIANDQRNE